MIYDEILFITDLLPAEIGLFALFYFVFSLALQFLLHDACGVVDLRTFDDSFGVAPVTGQG